jgi:hypothetical protein
MGNYGAAVQAATGCEVHAAFVPFCVEGSGQHYVQDSDYGLNPVDRRNLM